MLATHFKEDFAVIVLALCLGNSLSFATTEPVFETPSSSNDLYALEYKDYVRTLREKIEDIAYKKYDGTDDGTVSLDFEVGSDGNLIQYKANDESTDASQRIVDIGLDSLEEATPFVPFPEAMAKRYSKLMFTIVLDFQFKRKRIK